MARVTAPTTEALARFLEAGENTDKNLWIKSFRAFVREVLVPRQINPDDAPGESSSEPRGSRP